MRQPATLAAEGPVQAIKLKEFRVFTTLRDNFYAGPCGLQPPEVVLERAGLTFGPVALVSFHATSGVLLGTTMPERF